MPNPQGNSKVRTPRRRFLKDSAAIMLGGLLATRNHLSATAHIMEEQTPPDNRPKGATTLIEVAAGNYDRRNYPMFVNLHDPWQGHDKFGLTRTDTGKALDAQFERDPRPRLIWLDDDLLPAGHTRRYRLSRMGAMDHFSEVAALDDGRGVLLKAGDKPVLRYNQAVIPSPDPSHPFYKRSGFIHPVYNPLGQPVTDDSPPDHMMQHAVWFAWVDTRFENRQVNFWEQGPADGPGGGTGRVENYGVERKSGGTVCGHLRAILHHTDLTAPGGPRLVLKEIWDVRVYNLRDSFLFDFTSTQICAGTSPLLIAKYHYGGMAIRGNRNWFDVKNSEYLTSEGKTRKDGNLTRPRWVDMYGQIEGKVSGIAILDHPENLRFPQPVRLHPAKPYFCFTPEALGAFSIQPGTPYVSKYRFCVHVGPPDVAALDRIWNDFAYPAQARLVRAM